MNSKLSLLSDCRYFAAVILLLSFCGCRTVQPPTRPVANLFPTLMPITRLPRPSALPVTADGVSEVLSTIGCLDLLYDAGMLSTELDTLARGLNQRGYAEIDASRAGTSLHWLVLMRHDVDYWLVVGSFQDYPPRICRHGLSRSHQPAGSNVIDAGASSETFWEQQNDGWRTEMSQFTEAKSKKTRWQMRWTLRDAR